MHVNVSHIRIFYISVYFTHPYICIFYITMHMGMLQNQIAILEIIRQCANKCALTRLEIKLP